MMPSNTLRRLVATTVVGAFVALGVGAAHAQSAGELNSELSSIEGQMSGAMSSDAQAANVVEKLDNAEKTFAKVASSPKANKSELAPAYERLESMLSRIHE